MPFLLGLARDACLLIRAHSAETLDEHPKREEKPGRVQAQKDSPLVAGNLKGEIARLSQGQSGETRHNCGNDMGGINADQESNAALVVIQGPCCVDKNWQLDKGLQVHERVEPDQFSIRHKRVSQVLHVPD